MPPTIPLVKGTLDLLLLRALSEAPTHGYGLATWIESGSAGEITVEDSAIYQALRRLEGRRLITAEWRVTENNRRARYYELTSQGQAELARETATWLRYTKWVGILLEASDSSAPRPEEA